MTTDTISHSDHLPLEHEPQRAVKEVLLTEAEDSMLRWGDARSPQVQEWLQSHGITRGESIRAVVVGKEGQVMSNQVVTTELNGFFRPTVDMSEFQSDDDDIFFDEADVETISRGELENLRQSKSAEYVDSRTVQMDQIMSDEEMSSMVERADADSAYETVQTLIDDERFRPVAGIHIGENQFAFSPVFKSGKRRFVVGYVRTDASSEVKPRLFYESNSDGGWRATPGFKPDGLISKGEFTGQEYGQYVQTTKLNESVAAMLDGLTRTEDNTTQADWNELERLFPFGRSLREEGTPFESEVHFAMVGGHGLDAYLPGDGYQHIGAENGRAMLEQMQTPRGMEPDFSQAPERQYRINHSMLGDSTVGVYKGELQGRTVEWHIANDETGRVWVERLIFADGETTDYGTNKEVILAGALNMKPVEYSHQTGGEEGVDYDRLRGNYVDMRKTIDRMPWVQRYRAATGI